MKTKRLIMGVLFVSLLFSTLPTAKGETNEELKRTFDSIPQGAVNVKDFGAVGDGDHDDTEAIQQALFFAHKQRQQLRVATVTDYKGGAGDAAVPMVVFPDGTYKISDTLIGYREMYLTGIGNVVVKQTNPEKDIYYQHGMYRATIENMGFEGGRIQLQFWSANNDATIIIIDNCHFKDSSSEAVRSRSFCTKRLDGKNWVNSKPFPPFNVQKEEDGAFKLIGENDTSDLPAWCNSTLFVISNSEFENCMQAFNIATDGTVIEHCNIIANPQTLGPIMSCFSKIEFRNVTCVAPESQNDQYWIEANCYNIACRDSRFVSENPMCVIKQVAKPGYISASTIVDNCQFTSAGCPEGGVVDFQEVPNTFYFTGNSELSDQDVHAVTWRQPNTADFFTENRYFKLIPVDSQFNFCLARNTPNIITTLPESAHPFIRPDVPSQLLKQVAATIERCKRPDVKTLVFAVDYGVQADGETDDSEALQRAVDATAALPKSALVLPGKIIKLNHTVNLPQAITIIGNGCPYLLGDESCDAFNGIGVQNVFLKNIAFKGFMSALNVQTEANETSQVVIDGCKFYNCTTTVIKCLSNKSGKANKTTLEVKNSLVSGRTAIDSNAAHSLLSNIWLSGSWLADNQAYFINRAGIMLAESILGVPGCHKGKMIKHRTTGEEKLWEYGDNMRWFDNYGNLIIKDMRFGGEGGGLCPVFNRSATATLFMQGGFLSLSNTYTKKGYVYFMEPPKAMVLIANNNIPGTTERSVWIKDPESASIDQGSIFISGPGVRLSVVRDEHGVMNAH